MKTVLSLSNKKTKLPKQFQGDDNRFPASLPAYFISQYSKKGDVVFDPFAGLGTTLFVAHKMGRMPIGNEYSKARYEYIKSHLKQGIIIEGDARKLPTLPNIDLCITSPPYMPSDEKYNPLRDANGSYKQYLSDMRSIFSSIKQSLRKNGRIVIEVSNIKKQSVSTLAWDIQRELSKILFFEGEVIVVWKGKGTNGSYGFGYDHSYCLVFRKQ